MRRLTVCASVALALSVAACGTTVPRSQTAAGASSVSGSGVGPGQPSSGLADPAQPTQAPGALAAAGEGTSPTDGGPTGATVSGRSGAVTAGGAAAPGLSGRGVTPTTLTIGVAIATGTEAAGSALGISGAGQVPEEDMWKAVVDDVNRSGGVLGRKLVLYNHSVDLASYVANPAQTYAEVCADFRDDHKVFAALLYVADPSLRACLAKMGTPFVVYGAFTTVPEAAYREYGGSYLYAPSSITQERLAQLFVQSLMANSFTAKWDTANGGPGVATVKLGLIHADTPDQNNLYAAYTRELAKYGLRFSDTVTYTGDASTALASTQSAVLKFSSEGITHVFGASAFFLRYAESQHYRPRYAFLPGLGALGASNSPAEQLKGALTVGWSPTQDVNEAQDPGDTPGAARCRGLMRRAGLTKGNRQDLKLMYAVCDAGYSLRAALTAGQQPTGPGLRRGAESLGARLEPALTFAALLGPQRHYGVSSVRDMAYDSGCSCLKYTSRSNRS
jgi:hypothetical protein